MPIKFFLFLFLFATACGTAKKVDDLTVKEKGTQIEKIPMDLGKCPCGRSDWEKLPPGYESSPK